MEVLEVDEELALETNSTKEHGSFKSRENSSSGEGL